jgi:uncharacterized membrane protein HdeD (DUF308 family)
VKLPILCFSEIVRGLKLKAVCPKAALQIQTQKKGEIMIEALKRHWWVLVIRGICGIVFGVIALAYPGLALATLVLLFGAWVLIDGVFRIVGATAGRASDPDWGFHLIVGILGVVVGFLTFRAPGITALALIIYIAAWALMVGAAEIALAIKLRKEMKGEWFLILMGLASIIFAVLLLWNPGPGALALLWLIASYAIVFGVLAIIFGFRLRSLRTLLPS